MSFAQDGARWNGTIIKVKSDSTTLKAVGCPIYVIQRDSEQERIEVLHEEVTRSPWTVLSGSMLNSSKLVALQIDFQLEWLKKRTEATILNRRSLSGPVWHTAGLDNVAESRALTQIVSRM